MKLNELPNTDIQISELGLGCMSLPEDLAGARKIVHAALAGGINFLDTADMYQKGLNESNLGQITKSVRSNLVIATKVGNEWRNDGSGWDWNPRKEYILKAVEQSLSRLQTDYIDLYQLHGGTIGDPWEETLEAFEILKSQGKIRAFGISSIRPNVIRKVLTDSQPSTVMMQYNPMDRRPEEEAFERIGHSSAKVLVRGAFAKGSLIDKLPKEFLNHSAEEVAKYQQFIRDSGYSPESVLIHFGLSQSVVIAQVIGASSTSQLEKILEGYSEHTNIPDSFLTEIKKEIPADHYDSHR